MSGAHLVTVRQVSSVTATIRRVIETALSGGETVSFHIHGTCMSPVLQGSQHVIICKNSIYFPGDLVAYYCPYQNIYFAHRFLGCVWAGRTWKYLIMADNGSRPDTLVSKSNVLGKVFSHSTASLQISSIKRCYTLLRYCYWVFRLMLERCFTRSS
jgi:hypothetical protein